MKMDKDMDMDNDMDMGGMMMQMYFYVSSQATILFKSWNTTTWAGMLGSFIAVFLIAMLYESIKVLRSHLIYTANIRARKNAPRQTEYTQLNVTGNADENQANAAAKLKRLMCSKDHFVQTGLHFVQATLGYSLMLVAMTFNLWLFFAVVLGMTAGYFAFGWKQSFPEFNDDCCA